MQEDIIFIMADGADSEASNLRFSALASRSLGVGW